MHPHRVEAKLYVLYILVIKISGMHVNLRRIHGPEFVNLGDSVVNSMDLNRRLPNNVVIENDGVLIRSLSIHQMYCRLV